jgi:hypothetical protein
MGLGVGSLVQTAVAVGRSSGAERFLHERGSGQFDGSDVALRTGKHRQQDN